MQTLELGIIRKNAAGKNQKSADYLCNRDKNWRKLRPEHHKNKKPMMIKAATVLAGLFSTERGMGALSIPIVAAEVSPLMIQIGRIGAN